MTNSNNLFPYKPPIPSNKPPIPKNKQTQSGNKPSLLAIAVIGYALINAGLVYSLTQKLDDITGTLSAVLVRGNRSTSLRVAPGASFDTRPQIPGESICITTGPLDCMNLEDMIRNCIRHEYGSWLDVDKTKLSAAVRKCMGGDKHTYDINPRF